MNISKISLMNINANFGAKKTEKKSNATPIIHPQADLYLSNDKSTKQAENNALNSFFNKTEGQFYGQYAKNLRETITDIRVEGYTTLHDAEKLRKNSVTIQQNAKETIDNILQMFKEGEKRNLASKESGDIKTFYTYKNGKAVTLQNVSKNGHITLRADKTNNSLFVRKYNNNGDAELFGFDTQNGILREYMPKATEYEDLLHANEYYKYDENGNIAQYSYNYEKNSDKSDFSMIYYGFDNKGNLLEYSEDKETKADGSEKNGIIYHYTPSSRQFLKDGKQNMEIISYSEKTISNPNFGQKAAKKYVFAQDNLALSSYYKNLLIDENGESANLVMLFNDQEDLEEVRTKYQLTQNGTQLANKVFVYSDDEPSLCYLGYAEQLDGTNSYQKSISLL